ncbi:MerR family transcriptional regulator [Rothia sp. ZJ1223]|uniref:MerR family transcriptional regulator n=1 Tax=Rothia sp. ZJ1223 TaxID=2811098 RepID=UPI00195E4981|nr:MerR family transcriptional regulator [Rothia sp. ZJ1223]MBM7052229.1 MerR family transcriptional regulator [Rothia sp. ZJ1223]
MTTLEMVTSAEAAARLGVTQRYIAKLVKDGSITPLHKNPGRTGAYLFTSEEVEHACAMRELQDAGKTKAHRTKAVG